MKTAEIWRHLLDVLAKSDQDETTEKRRLHRIQCGFALLGFIFGGSYVFFYMAIDFWYAVWTILVSSLAIGAAIPMMRAGVSISFTGNWLTGVLVFGFTAMMYGEGGVTAHAAAWLAAAPLCGLMMISSRAAWAWAFISVSILTIFFALEMLGMKFPYRYAAEWHTLVAGLGFLGLGPFLFAIALTFELTRGRAVAAKERAMGNLAVANSKLKHANEEKDNFLGIVAHDLRNPLGLVDAYAQMLTMRDDIPGDALKQIDTILRSSKRMAGILDDLLNLNAIEQGNYPLSMDVYELGSVAEECAERARLKATEKGTVIQVKIASALNQAVIDERALGQVLDNLISNAVKYSPKASTVRIVSRQEGQASILEVIDDGPGFTDEDRKKLFQRFAKLSARPTGGESSTGLGLSIVKRITEAMSGTVECLPGEKIGTCFRLTFPAVEPQPVAAVEPEKVSSKPAPLSLRRRSDGNMG